MKISNEPCRIVFIALLFTAFMILPAAIPVQAEEYKALANVSQLRIVFDVSVGSPQGANNVFWAVRNIYQDKSVTALPERAQVAVVFRGPAVKLVSEDLSRWPEKDRQQVKTFQQTIRAMKEEGVVFEICQYAMKKAGVDKASVLGEVNQVGNGFVSIAGYQMQGYGVIAIQ